MAYTNNSYFVNILLTILLYNKNSSAYIRYFLEERMNKKKFLTSLIITVLAFCMILGGLFAATGGFSIRGISQIFSGVTDEK